MADYNNSGEATHLTGGLMVGGLAVGGSTSSMGYLGRGTALSPLLAVPASAIVYSTITIPGALVGDYLDLSRSTGMSTALGMSGAFVSAANEGTYAVINNQASTQSILAGSPFAYLLVR